MTKFLELHFHDTACVIANREDMLFFGDMRALQPPACTDADANQTDSEVLLQRLTPCGRAPTLRVEHCRRTRAMLATFCLTTCHHRWLQVVSGRKILRLLCCLEVVLFGFLSRAPQVRATIPRMLSCLPWSTAIFGNLSGDRSLPTCEPSSSWSCTSWNMVCGADDEVRG